MSFDVSLDSPHELRLPRLGSWPATVHVFDRHDPAAYAIQAAAAANRPLLVRGEPGTGKSQLARAATRLGKQPKLFLSVVVNAVTECQDLQWQFDAVGRLGEAQTLAQHSPEGGQRRLKPQRFLTPGPLWWAYDWDSAAEQYQQCASPLVGQPEPPEGWCPAHGSVLLIDEIDKADADLPNGLLETLGNGDFMAPYLRRSIRQTPDVPPPLVVITTNEERELPAAFLRRCLVLQLHLPTDKDKLLDLLSGRGQVHFPGQCSERVRRQAGELLWQDRVPALKEGLPAPGQAEYLDMLRALVNLAPNDETKQLALLERISGFVLKKNPQ